MNERISFQSVILILGNVIIKHRIDLSDETPFKQQHRRVPTNMIGEMRQQLDQLLACGIIRPSKSPWTSNLYLCARRMGS